MLEDNMNTMEHTFILILNNLNMVNSIVCQIFEVTNEKF